MTIGRSLTVYFVLAYAFAWAVYVPMAVFHLPLPWTVLGTLGPTLAAVVARRLGAGDYRAFRIVSDWARTLVVGVAGIIMVLAAYVVLPAVATADPGQLHWSTLVSLSVYNYSTLLGGPLLEEPGWRGFALPRLEAIFGPVRATVLLGVLWAGWHLPLFFYQGWTSSPAWIYLLLVVGLTFILTWAANLVRFAVVVPIAMHAIFNTVSRFLGGLFAGTNGPSSPLPFELVMALGGLALAAVLAAVTRGRLGYSGPRLTTSALESGF